jgi:hypothetical protein
VLGCLYFILFIGPIAVNMRMLRATDRESPLELVEIASHALPPFAILSHTWSSNSEDEVKFEDIEAQAYFKKPSYRKVRFACQQAFLDGYSYLWIDAICIDKKNPTELQEAINSMYRWYQSAQTCYAYLADVTDSKVHFAHDGEESQFIRTRWFERGWTLQELIAPKQVRFFNADWDYVGDKSALSGIITKVTGIPTDILLGTSPIDSASIAQRMSWASHRQTTRPEDMAYCLMGMFSVFMPLIYGEQDSAFLRLQDAIMQKNEDMSLFAWCGEHTTTECKHGLLATHPKQFRECASMPKCSPWPNSSGFGMSNGQLRIELPLLNFGPDLYAATLGCRIPIGESLPYPRPAILLRKKRDKLYRVNARQLLLVHEQKYRPERILVPQYSILADIALLDDGIIPKFIGPGFRVKEAFIDPDLGPTKFDRLAGTLSKPKLPRPQISAFLQASSEAICIRWIAEPIIMRSTIKAKGNYILFCCTTFHSEDTEDVIMVTAGQASKWMTFSARVTSDDKLPEDFSVYSELQAGLLLGKDKHLGKYIVRVSCSKHERAEQKREISVFEMNNGEHPIPKLYIDIITLGTGKKEVEDKDSPEILPEKPRPTEHEVHARPPAEDMVWDGSMFNRFREWLKRSRPPESWRTGRVKKPNGRLQVIDGREIDIDDVAEVINVKEAN